MLVIIFSICNVRNATIIFFTEEREEEEENKTEEKVVNRKNLNKK